MKKETKIIVGVLAGAALGATIALALSSDSNSELKGKVTDFFADLLDASKDKLAGLADKASGLADKASGVADRVKDKISEVNA